MNFSRLNYDIDDLLKCAEKGGLDYQKEKWSFLGSMSEEIEKLTDDLISKIARIEIFFDLILNVCRDMLENDNHTEEEIKIINELVFRLDDMFLLISNAKYSEKLQKIKDNYTTKYINESEHK